MSDDEAPRDIGPGPIGPGAPEDRIAVVGQGRLGSLLAAELGAEIHGRGYDGADADVVLLCVPDDEIGNAAAAIAPREGRLVGHCSGATTLQPLTEHGHEAFSMHPLMTVPAQGPPATLRGAWAAVAGSDHIALRFATTLALELGLRPFQVPDSERAAYHASASIASNFLITLEAFAEGLGTPREALAPLVRATVENWIELGPQQALTGPVARGDEATIARQRDAIAERAPALLDLFDELVAATRALAGAPA